MEIITEHSLQYKKIITLDFSLQKLTKYFRFLPQKNLTKGKTG